MELKEKIIQTLHKAASGLQQLRDDFFIIGSAALALSDVKIENTQDIDILTSKGDADLLKTVWASRDLHVTPKESDLFRSDLSRYDFGLLDVEITGGLEVCKNGKWQPLVVYDFETYPIADLLIKVPTLQEQKNILRFFGREKDLRKIKLIDERLKELSINF